MDNFQLLEKIQSNIDLMSEIIDRCIINNYSKTIEEDLLINKLILETKELWSYYNNSRKSSDLYLLHSKKLNLYKIGITKDIENRLVAIKKDVGVNDIEVLFLKSNMSNKENFLHKKFNKLNHKFIGKTNIEHREWFRVDEEIINYFKGI